MNLASAMKSEWIKLTTTKSVWWTSALILIVAASFGALNGLGVGLMLGEFDENDPLDIAYLADMAGPSSAISGVTLFGIMIIIIQSVINVTSEYTSNTIKATALANPKRIGVPFAKFVVYAVIAAALTFVSSVLAIWLSKLTLGIKITNPTILDAGGFDVDGVWTIIGRTTLYAALAVLVATGVAFLVRSTAAGIAALLLWDLVVEGAIVPLVPKVKEWLPPYMPFSNMEHAIHLQDVDKAPWGQLGSIGYFAAVCLVIFIAGTIVFKKRDA